MAREDNGVLIAEGVRDFDLDNIFDCGQCFRWEKTADGMYAGTAHGRVAVMEYDSDAGVLKIHGADEDDYRNIWHHYLDLDRDYSEIKKQLSCKDEVIAKAIEYGPGIRILNQDKWETLISFIISQNNNIPRIKKCINSLAEDLAPCRLGYRAKYLIDTAKMVAEEGIESLERLGTDEVSSDEAFDQLRRYTGVGSKVANCIALFSLGKMDRFPIDVWVRKVMNRLYGMDEGDMKAMADFAAEHFGEYGGIAQQYLFYYITHNKNL